MLLVGPSYEAQPTSDLWWHWVCVGEKVVCLMRALRREEWDSLSLLWALLCPMFLSAALGLSRVLLLLGELVSAGASGEMLTKKMFSFSIRSL